MNRQARNLTLFDTSLSHYFSTPFSPLEDVEKDCQKMLSISSTLFLDNFFRHFMTNFYSIWYSVRKMLSFYVKKSCRKLPSKNVGENYRQNILSKKTVIDSVFRQISLKNLKNFVECRCFMSKNVVEKNCCRIMIRQFFSSAIFVSKIRHHFQTAFFDKKFCRKMRSKNVVERSWYNLSKNTVKKYCRKIPSKNVC